MSPAQNNLQRGVALLTALVILAIAATLSVGMIWQREIDIRRTANIIQNDQALEYALGAEAWAGQILRRDYLQQPQTTDLSQDWALQLPPLPVQGGSITGRLQDLQGLFNLNNLVNAAGGVQPQFLQQFQRLLLALNLDPQLAYAVADWESAGDQPLPGGAKDEYYSRLSPPYLTAERPMTSVSELLLVKGITPEAYLKLQPYVCALPTGGVPTAVNLNTAPPPVLMSLAAGISADTAEAVAQARAQRPFRSIAEFTQLLPAQPALAVPTTLTSSYFLLRTQVAIGSSHLTLYSLLYRAGGGVTLPIRRTFGTL